MTALLILSTTLSSIKGFEVQRCEKPRYETNSLKYQDI